MRILTESDFRLVKLSNRLVISKLLSINIHFYPGLFHGNVMLVACVCARLGKHNVTTSMAAGAKEGGKGRAGREFTIQYSELRYDVNYKLVK